MTKDYKEKVNYGKAAVNAEGGTKFEVEEPKSPFSNDLRINKKIC